jgi:alpha-glucosidase
MLLLTLRGTPFVYYGEEIGMSDGPIPESRVVDVADRDPCRTPMQWDGSPGAGFSTAVPWLPVSPMTATVNVARQRDDPASTFSFYRSLIRERRGSEALRCGSYRTLPSPREVFAYLREAGDERRLIALNMGDRPARLRLPGEFASAVVALSTDPARPVGDPAATLDLAPDEGVLLRA